MNVSLSDFARETSVETAFNVLAKARQLAAQGKRVIELEIGDSPFPSTASAKRGGVEAILTDQSHYGPSAGLPGFCQAASEFVNREYGLRTTAANIVAGPGAKVFELFFCEAFLNPGDGVLVFSPYFPTYIPNILRRQGRVWLSDLRQERAFRPDLDDVERFLNQDPHPKAIFLNSPHNPTGGVAEAEDLEGLADLVRGRDVAILSDEPYDRMVWRGEHRTIAALPGMLDQCVAVYTFSKSYSMSGWRLGYAVTSSEIAEVLSKLFNTSLSCTSSIAQWAGIAALRQDDAESRETMGLFRGKVERLAQGLNRIEGVRCLDPAGTFYVFPRVAAICNRLGITSHGLAHIPAGGRRRRIGSGLSGRGMLRRGGGGFPAVQLRRARREDP